MGGFTMLLLLLGLWLLYVIAKFGFNPYLRMMKYAKYRGSVWIPFIPILGAFKHAQDSFKSTGDENYFSKRSFQTNPEARFFIFNALDKCFLLITDPSLLQQFFNKQEYYIKQPSFIQNKARLIGYGVPFSQGQQWSKRRKIMSSIFHFSLFNNFIPTITNIIDRQFSVIRKQGKYSLVAQEFSSLLAGDTIINTFFGIDFNEKIDDQTISVWLSKLIADNFYQQRSFRYLMFGVKILQLGIFAEDKSVNRRLQQFKSLARSTIQQKMEQVNQDKGTVLQLIKQKGHYLTQQGYSQDDLIEQFMTFFVAGTDTTAHLITMCLYYLSIYPEHQQSLREQIQESKVLQHLEYKNITNMKFLQAFVKQTFRHYNYVSIFPRKCVKTHQIGEITVNQGDIVMPGWAQNLYNEAYFPNPDNFDPSRWLKANDKDLTYIFSPFSLGARSCLGQNFALLQSKTILIKLITQFKLHLKEGYKHLLKTNSLYGPVNPIIINLEDV